jgi:hypothetical protein
MNRMTWARRFIVAGCAFGVAVWVYAALHCSALWPLAGGAVVGAALIVRHAPNGRR